MLFLSNLEIPSINTDVARSETSVGHRRRVQPHTPALTEQPEQRPPSPSGLGVTPLPCLTRLFGAWLPVSARRPPRGEAARRTKGARGELFPPHALTFSLARVLPSPICSRHTVRTRGLHDARCA